MNFFWNRTEKTTKRTHCPELDAMLGKEIEVPNLGFVTVIDYMGDDKAIVEAARRSISGSGGKPDDQDRRLIRYLMRKRHTSPFEMCELKLHLTMPIFVARQFLRHRTASVNELSGRYSDVPADAWVPNAEDICLQGTMKQGRTDPIDVTNAEMIREELTCHYRDAYDIYHDMRRKDVAREVARTVLPMSQKTNFFWKIDLHNLLHFLSLRMADDAQAEIRAFAEEIADIVEKWVPITWNAFENYQLDAVTLSYDAIRLIAAKLNGIESPLMESQLTQAEKREINETFDLRIE